MSESLSLWGLFASAFISSTLFPGGSEIVLGALVAQGAIDKGVLLVVASFGNTLGGFTSYGLGRLIALRYGAETLRKPAYIRAVARVQRWGAPVLLLSWVPVIGDPLCVAAGWLRIAFMPALVLMALGKTARYAMIVWLA